ncbi:MAG: hypothetical protein ACLSUU_02925 [Christensenellales bacterium]
MAYRIKIVNLDTDEVMMDAESRCIFASFDNKENGDIGRIAFTDCDRMPLLCTYVGLKYLAYELATETPAITIAEAMGAVDDIIKEARLKTTLKTKKESEKEAEKGGIEKFFDHLLSEMKDKFEL